MDYKDAKMNAVLQTVSSTIACLEACLTAWALSFRELDGIHNVNMKKVQRTKAWFEAILRARREEA
jgi:hypothetical protein